MNKAAEVTTKVHRMRRLSVTVSLHNGRVPGLRKVKRRAAGCAARATPAGTETARTAAARPGPRPPARARGKAPPPLSQFTGLAGTAIASSLVREVARTFHGEAGAGHAPAAAAPSPPCHTGTIVPHRCIVEGLYG